jgi:hypothetical protein
MFQTFIVELKFQNGSISRRAHADLEVIATKLSRVGTFLDLWGNVLSNWPAETRNLYKKQEVREL